MDHERVLMRVESPTPHHRPRDRRHNTWDDWDGGGLHYALPIVASAPTSDSMSPESL
jgi:hypothetical protein